MSFVTKESELLTKIKAQEDALANSVEALRALQAMDPCKRLAIELHEKHCDSGDGMSRCFWETDDWASIENAEYLNVAGSLLDYLSLENALKVSDIFATLN